MEGILVRQVKDLGEKPAKEIKPNASEKRKGTLNEKKKKKKQRSTFNVHKTDTVFLFFEFVS